MKRILFMLLLLCPLTGFGQATIGYHRVNQILARAPQTVAAQVVPYAKVYVTVTATGLAATIYSDPLLSAQITPSVVTADLNGNYSYYIPLSYMVTETISSPGQGNLVTPNIGENSAAAIITAFASPPPIGNVAPNTGSFTTLSATAGIFTAAQIAALGNITPGTGSFTTLTASVSATSPDFIGSLLGNATSATSATTAGTLTTPLAANQFLGSLTAVAPTGQTIPSCSTSASALNYTSGTGFICNTAVQAANVTGIVAVANGGTGDTGTQWSQTTPTPTCQSGTPTTISSVVRVKTIGKTAFVSVAVIDTTNGTCGGWITVGLPFTSNSITSIMCREVSVTGSSGAGTTVAGSANLLLVRYDNASWGVTGYQIACSGVVEIQ